MEGEGQLDHAEVGTEVSGVLGDGGDDEVADLAGQGGQLVVAQIAQVTWLADLFEPHRPVTLSPLGTRRVVGVSRRSSARRHRRTLARRPHRQPDR